ncbi:hypothetical protein B0J14DRAFT_577164 [Halenospora varia]|nr:hypothetical protein B0J14DRAFT_577164 [Halenospora varia]
MSDEIIDMLLGTNEEVSTLATDVSETSEVHEEGYPESNHDNSGDVEIQTSIEDPNHPCSYILAIWCRPELPPGLRSERQRISRRSRKSSDFPGSILPTPKAHFRKESMSHQERRERHHATVNFHHDRSLCYRVFKRSSLARETILRRMDHVSSKLTYYGFEYRVRGGNGIQGDDMIGDGFDGEGRRLCEGCGDTVCLWENMTPVTYVSESADRLGSWSDLSSSTSSVEGIPNLEGVRVVVGSIENGVGKR